MHAPVIIEKAKLIEKSHDALYVSGIKAFAFAFLLLYTWHMDRALKLFYLQVINGIVIQLRNTTA